MSDEHFYARQAAVALLNMAKTTSDPEIAAALIGAAADLKDQTGELPRLSIPRLLTCRGTTNTALVGGHLSLDAWPLIARSCRPSP